MRDAPLVIPFILDPSQPRPSRQPHSDRLSATWTTSRYGRRRAFVDDFNSVWITSTNRDKGKSTARADEEDSPTPTGGARRKGTGAGLSIGIPDITLNPSSSAPGSAISPSVASSRTYNRSPHAHATSSSSASASPVKPHRPSQLRSHSSASVSLAQVGSTAYNYGGLGRDGGQSAAQRSRAASTASSILSSGSHYRRTSALSPTSSSPRIGTTALSAEVALADTSTGHGHGTGSSQRDARAQSLGDIQESGSSKDRHKQLPDAATRSRRSADQAGRSSLSDNTDLLDHLRDQCRPVSPSTDRGIGLGIGFGLPGRSLAVHGKAIEELSSATTNNDGPSGTGALSPKSTHSTESSRTLSSRFLPWRPSLDTAADGTQERRTELMDKVAEVEVEREMEREVAEDEREKVEERLVRDAQDELSTPRGSMVLDDTDGGRLRAGDDSRGERRMKRLILPICSKGKAVRMMVQQEAGVLIVLRDTGIADIVSLDSESLIASAQLNELEDKQGNPKTNPGKDAQRLYKFWKWLDIAAATVDKQNVLVAHGIPWSSGGMPSPNGQVTRVIMLRLPSAPVTSVAAGWEVETLAALELAGVGTVTIQDDPPQPSIIHHTPNSTFSYPLQSPSSPRPISKQTTSGSSPATSTTQLRSVSAAQPKPSFGLSPSSSFGQSPGQGLDALRRHRSQLLPKDTAQPSSTGHTRDQSKSGGVSRDGERGFAKLLGIRREEVKEQQEVPMGWGIGPGVEVDKTAASPDGAAVVEIPLKAEGEVVRENGKASNISAVVPLDIETCFIADNNGEVTKQRFSDVLSGRLQPMDNATVDRLPSAVTCMVVVHPDRDMSYLVAGDEDGMLRIWGASTFELYAMMSLFAFPVISINLLDMPQAGTMRGQVLCTSKAGTIALVSLDDMEQSFLIPASRDPLRRLFVGGKDIMMVYANGKARVWNVETLEFRRSTALDAAEDMLSAGDWCEIDLSRPASSPMPLRNTSMELIRGSDAARTLEVDLRQLGAWLRQQRPSAASPRSLLGSLRALLPVFLTRGIDEGVDRVCEKGLGVAWSGGEIHMGGKRHNSAFEVDAHDSMKAWRISPEATGMRQLAIVSLLRPFLDSPEHEASAAQAIAFYTAALPADTIDADLRFFARYYLDSSHDIHLAARILFDSRMDRMSAEEIEQIANEYTAELPSNRPATSASHRQEGLALTILGGMALHRYSNINPAALKAVAESVNIYLASDNPVQLGLAIELASKGFSTWQTFIDPAEMLRRMFYLSTHNISNASENTSATNVTGTGVSNSSIAAQARLAVLHVASSNPALFMSTLSMDILDARTVEGRKSIMKLCVYMARKKPEVLENSLPKVVEAVVKSLDPNVGRMREDVQQTATVILSELVLAFTTVDFHSGSQRLAMGTHEGAVIMYDLKTASRLYVLEPHKHPVSAVMFSPDGRRLVTVSLEEGDITVWKVGSSLSGFFNVGGPPRQGGEKGEPFKRIEFARADNGPLKSTTALSDIQITWLGQKQVKVVIKETALTFET